MVNRAELLQKWEDTYKKGLLTFWLLLLLHERSAYPYEMSEALRKISQETITADEKSIYRALGRFEKMEIVGSELRESSIGPSRRYYSLTEPGIQLLADFIRRNIKIFENPLVADRVEGVLNGAHQKKDDNDHNRIP